MTYKPEIMQPIYMEKQQDIVEFESNLNQPSVPINTRAKKLEKSDLN